MFTALPFGPITQGALPFFSSGRGALLAVRIRLPGVGIQSLLCGLGLFASFLALFFVSAACFFSSFARAFAAAAFAFALILASAASFSAGRSPSRSFVPLPILCSDVRLSLLCSLGAWRVRRTKTSFGEPVSRSGPATAPAAEPGPASSPSAECASLSSGRRRIRQRALHSHAQRHESRREREREADGSVG